MKLNRSLSRLMSDGVQVDNKADIINEVNIMNSLKSIVIKSQHNVSDKCATN